jgi:hypothetical protein
MAMPADPANHLAATSLTVTLHRGQSYIDFELTIQDKAKDNWPEADWLCLPFRLDAPQFRVARTLGVMDPARDILPGANRHLYAVGAGAALTGKDGSSVSLCPLDHPLISLDQPGMWKFSLDFVPKRPVVFVNLYNNQWNTNYRYWYPGTWSSRVRLWFGRDLAIPALEARLPLLAAKADGGPGQLPSVHSGIAVSRAGVLVTAFRSGSGDGHLRLWELAGESGNVRVKLPSGVKARVAQPLDLRGSPTGAPIPVRGDGFEFAIQGYAPATFRLA